MILFYDCGRPDIKNQQENNKKTKICKKLKSSTNGLFLGIIGNTARDYTKGITVGY